MIPFKPPVFESTSFNCPYCKAFANMRWGKVNGLIKSQSSWSINSDIHIATCSHCQKQSVWNSEDMILPEYEYAGSPNPDLTEEIKKDYLEAGSILSKSPRGAAALLRLCIQKLCKQLGEDGKNINDDIKSLVQKGLSPKIQQALDIVRVIGNNAVHPGQITLSDTTETAHQLFSLVNIIADVMISQPKHIEEMYNALPENQRKAIENRDKK